MYYYLCWNSEQWDRLDIEVAGQACSLDVLSPIICQAMPHTIHLVSTPGVREKRQTIQPFSIPTIEFTGLKDGW